MCVRACVRVRVRVCARAVVIAQMLSVGRARWPVKHRQLNSFIYCFLLYSVHVFVHEVLIPVYKLAETVLFSVGSCVLG